MICITSMEIQGYPDYLIYEDGRVFSKKSRKMLKPRVNGIGYKQVDLYNHGKQKTILIHRLVALYYIDNPNNFPEVDHIDRNKVNNDISNLRFVDRSTNCHNQGTYCTNKLGHKNISYVKSRNRYLYSKMVKGTYHRKSFKTLEEAIAYKSAFET